MKLTKSGSSYFIKNKVTFEPLGSFKKTTINKVFAFAHGMTFAKKGEHRKHRSGGLHNRTKQEIFIDTFQGKLSEIAVLIEIYKKHEVDEFQYLPKPDFDTYGLGSWDSCDIKINDYFCSIKSTKHFGNLLLLETKDWNSNGEYIPNLANENTNYYDFIILVRIKPSVQEHIGKLFNKILNTNFSKTLLNELRLINWEYDIPGFITNDDLKTIIKENYLIPQKAKLNGVMEMDADNYYIQTGNMRDFNDLLNTITRK